jgi:hypothetical protein
MRIEPMTQPAIVDESLADALIESAAARYSGKTRIALAKLALAGQIRAHRVGSRLFYEKAQLDALRTTSAQ